MACTLLNTRKKCCSKASIYRTVADHMNWKLTRTRGQREVKRHRLELSIIMRYAAIAIDLSCITWSNYCSKWCHYWVPADRIYYLFSPLSSDAWVMCSCLRRKYTHKKTYSNVVTYKYSYEHLDVIRRPERRKDAIIIVLRVFIRSSSPAALQTLGHVNKGKNMMLFAYVSIKRKSNIPSMMCQISDVVLFLCVH